jgi:16S rRNA (cytosine967-C5)-methyltransferase
MLRRAASLVSPDGRLVFATCSLEPEEGEEQLGFVRQALPSLEPEPVTEPPAAAFATAAGAVRTVPHLPVSDDGPTGLDGFFAARFRRR